MMMASLVAYLDTCIVSGLASEDLLEAELVALLQILEAQKKGIVALVTSKVTKEEIDRIPHDYRRKHQIIYNLLADVPIAKAFRRDRALSFLPWELGMRLQPMLAQLITVLPDEADARHIYQAAQNAVKCFVTTDSKTILSHRTQIERIAGIKPLSPQEFAIMIASAGAEQ